MRLLTVLFLCAIAASTQTLHSPQLEVILDRASGLPSEYRLLSNQSVIHGAEPGHAITATVFQAGNHKFDKITVKPQSVDATATRADFHFQADAGSFTLRYELQGVSVFVSLEDIVEKPGYQLIDVGTPDLATVREEDGGG
jgi:hypothetical protein